MAKLFVYALSPIDFWPGWMKEADYLASVKNYDDLVGDSFVDDYTILRREALDEAKRVGWEGDIREGPFVSGLPSDLGEIRVMMAWKQDNNGTTWIASPVELAHLKEQRIF